MFAGRASDNSPAEGGVSWYHLLFQLLYALTGVPVPLTTGKITQPLQGPDRRGIHRSTICLAPAGRSLGGDADTCLQVMVCVSYQLYQRPIFHVIYLGAHETRPYSATIRNIIPDPVGCGLLCRDRAGFRRCPRRASTNSRRSASRLSLCYS